jgi:hypothetical protein
MTRREPDGGLQIHPEPAGKAACPVSRGGAFAGEETMEHAMPFGDVLEAIDKLSLEDQEALLDILRRRIADRGRKTLAAEIEEARREFAEGRCRPATAEEVMKEIIS